MMYSIVLACTESHQQLHEQTPCWAVHVAKCCNYSARWHGLRGPHQQLQQDLGKLLRDFHPQTWPQLQGKTGTPPAMLPQNAMITQAAVAILPRYAILACSEPRKQLHEQTPSLAAHAAKCCKYSAQWHGLHKTIPAAPTRLGQAAAGLPPTDMAAARQIRQLHQRCCRRLR